MTAASGPCTVSIQDSIYEEKEAAEWWYAIQADLAVLEQALGLEEDGYAPFTVYIVEKALDGTQLTSLYCAPEDILSGDYRGA